MRRKGGSDVKRNTTKDSFVYKKNRRRPDYLLLSEFSYKLLKNRLVSVVFENVLKGTTTKSETCFGLRVFVEKNNQNKFVEVA